MFIFLSQKGSTAFYFLENKEYNIGRRDTDILIKNDSSISKLHAVVTVEDDKIYLTDFESKYQTFVNGKAIPKHDRIEIEKGYIIQFGILQSIFCVEHKNINVLCSNLPDTDKLNFTNLIKKLNGTVLKKWSRNCTHVVVSEIMLTLKVLIALMQGIPIVSLQFWEDMQDRICRNIPPPVEADYRPPLSQMFLSKNVSLKYQANRKVLFQNKIFVFKTSKSRGKVQDIIGMAGGRSILYSDEKITEHELTSNSPQYLFVIDEGNSQQSASNFDEIVQHLKKLNKRLIPHQEIAMALLNCSCEKDCNPNFDRVGTLMELGEANMVNPPVMLAMETEPLTHTQSDVVKTEGFAPETYEDDIFAPVGEPPVSSTQVDVVDLLESSPEKGTGAVKRLGGDLSKEEAKRKKIGAEKQESCFLSPISKVAKSKTIQDYFKIARENSTTATQTLTTGKKSLTSASLASDKQQETASNTLKRKSDEQSSERPTKRRNERVNPFAALSKLKTTSNVTQISSKEPKSSKKNLFARLSELSQTSSGPKNTITIDDDDNGVNINEPNIKQESTMFAVTPMDLKTERSFRWLSKSQVPVAHADLKLDISNPLTALLESFRGCVVVETKSLVVSRGRCDVGHDTVDASGHCVKNYKKFKKVKPLRVQTTIIPESSYVKVICNQSQAIGSDFEDDDGDGVQNPFSKDGPSPPKKSGRKTYGI